MSAASWPAPAKLNLFLNVERRREDGYHDLQTVFQLLDFGDSLEFALRADGAIRRPLGPRGVPESEDLCVRAARTLAAACGVSAGVDIRVHKRIPMGGGLGGGSSDAATTLHALNRLWGLGLGIDELARLAGGLGADVPVFVRGRSAWAEGIGDRLTPIELPPQWYLIVDPGAAVSTRDLFAALRLTRVAPRQTITDFVSGRATGNVFEPLVRARYPEVAQALDWLGGHAPARLSGTGACVFAAFASREAAERTASVCPHGFEAIVARGVDCSPLLDRLQGTDCDP